MASPRTRLGYLMTLAALLCSCSTANVLRVKRIGDPSEVFSSPREAYGIVGESRLIVVVHRATNYNNFLWGSITGTIMSTFSQRSANKKNGAILQDMRADGIDTVAQNALSSWARSRIHEREGLSIRQWHDMPVSQSVEESMPPSFEGFMVNSAVSMYAAKGNKLGIRVGVELGYKELSGEGSTSTLWSDSFYCDDATVPPAEMTPDAVRRMVRRCINQLEPWMEMELSGLSGKTAGLKTAKAISAGGQSLTGHVLLDDDQWVVLRGETGATLVMPRGDIVLTYLEGK